MEQRFTEDSSIFIARRVGSGVNSKEPIALFFSPIRTFLTFITPQKNNPNSSTC